MVPRLTDMKYVSGYKLWLKFEDGREGVVDLSQELWGDVFEPLKDPERFKSVRLDQDLNTVCWDSGADFAPEFLYARLGA